MSRNALIVGINQYQALPSLGAAAADAQAIAQLLQIQGEFRVSRLPEVINADQELVVGMNTLVTSQALEEALIRLFQPNGGDTTTFALFYFSGHGLQRQAGIREGYLATSDVNPGNGNFGISFTWLRRLVQESHIKQVAVILDCCHSGEIFNFKEANPTATDGKSRMFMAASRAYEAAYESLDGNHSVLTKALLSGLDPHRVESGQVSNHSLIDWVSCQLQSEVQQPMFEYSGGEMILTRVRGSNPPALRAQLKSLSTLSQLKQRSYAFCPYLGLEAFGEKHADYFFGRDDLIERLLGQMQRSRLCAVVGASSSGKTSLLRAGLLPQLRKGIVIEGSDRWIIKLLTPGPQPLRSLAAVFTAMDTDEIALATQLHQAETLLRESDQGLVQLVTATLMQTATTPAPQVWLMIDQFEELCRPTEDQQILAERHQFVRCLLRALADSATPLGIMIGLRADAMAGLAIYDDLLSQLTANMVTVGAIPYQQIKAVITKPAEKIGLQIEPMLLHHLTLDLTGAPGELALLQQTLLELWRRRESSSFLNGGPRLTADAYLRLGGVKKVLISRAEAVYQSLSAAEQMAAERIFLALCELGEGQEDGKRRAYKRELINHHFSEALINQTLEKLITARLVIVGQELSDRAFPSGSLMSAVVWSMDSEERTASQRWLIKPEPMALVGSRETLDLAHKSLISDWARLGQWLTERREVLRNQRRLEMTAGEWQQRGRPRQSEYLLGGRMLKAAVTFRAHQRATLSLLALDFIEASCQMRLRQRLQIGVLSLMVPLAMVAGMTVSVIRHRLLPAPSLSTVPAVTQPDPLLTQGTQSATSLGRLPAAAIAPPANQFIPPPEAAIVQGSRLPESSAGALRFDRHRVIPRISQPVEEMSPSQLALFADNPAYVIKSAGKVISPHDPHDTIEVWVIHPRNLELSQAAPVPLPAR